MEISERLHGQDKIFLGLALAMGWLVPPWEERRMDAV